MTVENPKDLKRLWPYLVGIILILALIAIYQSDILQEGAWMTCGESRRDFVSDLIDLGDPNARGITIEACIPGGRGDYFIESPALTPDEMRQARKASSPFPVETLITNFLVMDVDTREMAASFDPPLEIKITYSAEAWKEILARGYKTPRVVYLVKKDGDWEDTWIEFESGQIQYLEPEKDGSPGILIITIEELPDPLIGGC
jgi:hypothetical protein